ncbi:hypothetical protein BDB01DRAFT_850905 [Pilobolus umbonatus]|nr:hypothetical protein BDB01DRAFT_850905 [Pilobolus umbonatus]
MHSITSDQPSLPIEQRKMAVPRKRLNRATSPTSAGNPGSNNGIGSLPKFSFGNTLQTASLAISCQGTNYQSFSNAVPTFNFGEIPTKFSAVHTPAMSQSSIGGFSMSSHSSTARSLQFLPSVPSTKAISFGGNSTTSSSSGFSAPVEQNGDDNLKEDTEPRVPDYISSFTFPTSNNASSFSTETLSPITSISKAIYFVKLVKYGPSCDASPSFLVTPSVTSTNQKSKKKNMKNKKKDATLSEEAHSNTKDDHVMIASVNKDSLDQVDEENKEASSTAPIIAVVSEEEAPDKAPSTEKEPVTENIGVSTSSEEKGPREVTKPLSDDSRDKPSTTTPFTFVAPLKQLELNTSTPLFVFWNIIQAIRGKPKRSHFW